MEHNLIMDQEDKIHRKNLINSNLVKIQSGRDIELRRADGETFEDVLQNKGPWLEEHVGKQFVDWNIISTGYLWFRHKEDKVMFILAWVK